MQLFGDILPFIGFKSLWYTVETFTEHHPQVEIPPTANWVRLKVFALGWFGYGLCISYKAGFFNIEGEE